MELESGQSLSRLTLSYQTFGELNEDKSNAIWIVHALTGDTNPVEWWPGVVGPGMPIDTDKYFVVCANTLGSHYGSTSPLSINPDTGTKYYHTFPTLTNRDVAQAFSRLADHLELSTLHMLIGPSLGGQQALEWAITEPERMNNLVLIATNAIHSPYGIAWNESQRMAIISDATWSESKDDAGLSGLKAARSIALISYRTMEGYNLTQSREEKALNDTLKAASYQRYQGEKIAKRFNAYSYMSLINMMDRHDVGRDRGGVEKALATVKAKTTLIGIDSDVLFPLWEQRYIHRYIPDSTIHKIGSSFGHDGFLTESVTVGSIFRKIL